MAAALTHRLTACLTLDAVLLFAEISSDGKQLLTLTGVRGAEICVWNVHSFAQTARLPVTSVPCLARFSPDGSRIITGDRDGAVSVWSIAGQRLEHTLDHHRDQILDVQFETKTERMLVCSADSSISMWHFPSCEFLGTVARESVTIRSVSTLAATDRIACACVNGSLSLWDSIECNRITELAPDRVWRASQSSTPSGGAWVDPNRAHTGALTVARFSPNGLYLATASLDCTVKVWNVSSFHRNADSISSASERQRQRDDVSTIAFNPVSDLLNGEEPPLDNGFQPVLLFTIRFESACTLISWDSKSAFIAAASDDCTFKLYSVDSNLQMLQLNLPSALQALQLNEATFSKGLTRQHSVELHDTVGKASIRPVIFHAILTLENRVMFLAIEALHQHELPVTARSLSMPLDKYNDPHHAASIDPLAHLLQESRSSTARIVQDNGLTMSHVQKGLAHGSLSVDYLLTVFAQSGVDSSQLLRQMRQFHMTSAELLRAVIKLPQFAPSTILQALSSTDAGVSKIETEFDDQIYLLDRPRDEIEQRLWLKFSRGDDISADLIALGYKPVPQCAPDVRLLPLDALRPDMVFAYTLNDFNAPSSKHRAAGAGVTSASQFYEVHHRLEPFQPARPLHAHPGQQLHLAHGLAARRALQADIKATTLSPTVLGTIGSPAGTSSPRVGSKSKLSKSPGQSNSISKKLAKFPLFKETDTVPLQLFNSTFPATYESFPVTTHLMDVHALGNSPARVLQDSAPVHQSTPRSRLALGRTRPHLTTPRGTPNTVFVPLVSETSALHSPATVAATAASTLASSLYRQHLSFSNSFESSMFELDERRLPTELSTPRVAAAASTAKVVQSIANALSRGSKLLPSHLPPVETVSSPRKSTRAIASTSPAAESPVKSVSVPPVSSTVQSEQPQSPSLETSIVEDSTSSTFLTEVDSTVPSEPAVVELPKPRATISMPVDVPNPDFVSAEESTSGPPLGTRWESGRSNARPMREHSVMRPLPSAPPMVSTVGHRMSHSTPRKRGAAKLPSERVDPNVEQNSPSSAHLQFTAPTSIQSPRRARIGMSPKGFVDAVSRRLHPLSPDRHRPSSSIGVVNPLNPPAVITHTVPVPAVSSSLPLPVPANATPMTPIDVNALLHFVGNQSAKTPRAPHAPTAEKAMFTPEQVRMRIAELQQLPRIKVSPSDVIPATASPESRVGDSMSRNFETLILEAVRNESELDLLMPSASPAMPESGHATPILRL